MSASGIVSSVGTYQAVSGATTSAGAETATLTNSPVAGNPNVWIEVTLPNGNVYLVPGWAKP